MRLEIYKPMVTKQLRCGEYILKSLERKTSLGSSDYGRQSNAETLEDSVSLGFRKYRSAQDAMEYGFSILCRKDSPEWVLEGDIKEIKTSIYEFVKDAIIVDDWDEVCRENTDIENLYIECGLNREMTYLLQDVLCNSYFQNVKDSQSIMFNLMGMGIFDLAIANYFYQKVMLKDKGIAL